MKLSTILSATLASAVLLGSGAAFSADAAANNTKPLVWVWYPNESTPEKASSRMAIIEHVSKALGGRKIVEQLTTDYSIAIEALVHGNAAFSWFGGEGYVAAHHREPAVKVVVTNTGKSGLLKDAKYYSMICVRKDDAPKFKVNGVYSLDAYKQKSFSFVSNSSTSGFRVPSSVISKHFKVKSDELIEGGKDKVFSDVLFGGSHQGSMLNVIEKRADVGAFANTMVASYVEFTKGSFDEPKSGDVMRIAQSAAAPFDKYFGHQLEIAQSVPVLNAPIVANSKLVTPAELKAVTAAFTSEAMKNDKRVFGNIKDTEKPSIFAEGETFIAVTDQWYNPIRVMAGLPQSK